MEVSFNGGLTRVMNAFFRGTRPREYVDSAPHTVADASPTLSDCRGFAGSPRHRHASSCRLDPLDAGVRAAASAWLVSTSASACAASRA